MAFDQLVGTSIAGAGVAQAHRHLMATVVAFACLAASMTVDAGEVFRCTVEGKVNYSDHPCNGTDSQPVDVIVNQGYAPVPPPVAPDPATAPVAAPSDAAAKPAPADPGASVRYDAAEDLKQQCRLLDKQLRRNESAARHGSSGAAMDALREDKRRIEDEQRELGC